MSYDVEIAGVRADSLGTYLMGLGIIRLVSTQVDPTARARWGADGSFVLTSSLDRDALVMFFADTYVPSPVMSPWNKDGGFLTGNRWVPFMALSTPRVDAYKLAVETARGVIKALGVTVETVNEQKSALVQRLRAELPEEALSWIDTVLVAYDKPAYAAMLGAGGCDGRIDIAINFAERVTALFTPKRSKTVAPAGATIRSALFADGQPHGRENAVVGFWFPAVGGGANMGGGDKADPMSNPWQLVLAVEGAMVCVGARAHRTGPTRPRAGLFPFDVTASATRDGSSTDGECIEAREVWMPKWRRPASLAEVTGIFAEGRMDVTAHRKASSGVDAARALATLRVGRGIESYSRFSITKRNGGQSRFACYLGEPVVQSIDGAELLVSMDGFIDGVRGQRASKDMRADVAIALRRFEADTFDFCQGRTQVVTVLAAYGNMVRAVSRSPKLWKKAPQELPAAWLDAADDGSAEFAVAAAITSWHTPDDSDRWTGIQAELCPIKNGKWDAKVKPVWLVSKPLMGILAISRRRMNAAGIGEVPWSGRSRVTEQHVAALLAGEIDHTRLDELCYALAFVNQRRELGWTSTCDDVRLPAAFGVLRAVTSPTFMRDPATKMHPGPAVASNIVALATAGRHDAALTLTQRRIVGSDRTITALPRLIGNIDPMGLAVALVVPLNKNIESRIINAAGVR